MRYVRWRAPEVEAVDTIMLGGFGLLLLIPHLILLLIKYTLFFFFYIIPSDLFTD